MAYLIYICFFLVLFHFVLEGIILPAERLKMRYRFFELRDKLRLHQVLHQDRIAEQEFNYLHSMLNSAIGSLKHFTIIDIFILSAQIKDNDTLSKKVLKRQNIIENSKNQELVAIYNQIGVLGSNAAFLNSSGMLIYLFIALLPLFLLSLIIRLFINLGSKFFRIKELINSRVEAIFILPNHTIDGHNSFRFGA